MTAFISRIVTVIFAAIFPVCFCQCTSKTTNTAAGTYTGGSDDFYHADGSGAGAYGGATSANSADGGEYSDIYAQGNVTGEDYSGDSSSYSYEEPAPVNPAPSSTSASGSYGGSSASTASRPSTSTAPRSSSASANTSYHTVVKGETLFRISQNYGTTVAALQDANQLPDYTIYPGQKLIIPR